MTSRKNPGKKITDTVAENSGETRRGGEGGGGGLIRRCCNGLEFGGPFDLTAMTGTVAASQTGQTVGSAPHQTRSCEFVRFVGAGRRFWAAEAARMGQ